MIAGASFGPPFGRVRRLRFVPRASVPLEIACVVANGVRETLRELLGERCELVLGEPAALGAHAWAELSRDARRLVRRAFGEGDDGAPELSERACSALELHALERIAARCAGTFGPLCAESHDVSRPVGAHEVPACAAYFDLRVHAPLALTLGIGVVRELPDPAPAGAIGPHALGSVTVEARAVFAEGTLDAASFVKIRPGAVVKLDTKVGAPASLNLGGRRLATGVPGVVASRTAFLVHDVALGAQ
ncbi:MAG TPA: FliM/FliN family flagellar motor C-terminal domain-containing protein [Candidatus Limnocylindrales bacterium]|nr:FliM/FliN family flagellar motor C-terminal domain-containing protein [Candidatus Limnocylindrales bacterium]